jgi:hypothetical protein
MRRRARLAQRRDKEKAHNITEHPNGTFLELQNNATRYERSAVAIARKVSRVDKILHTGSLETRIYRSYRRSGRLPQDNNPTDVPMPSATRTGTETEAKLTLGPLLSTDFIAISVASLIPGQHVRRYR